MSRRRWYRPPDVATQGREATVARIIEAIDDTAPETKAHLAAEVGISEQYLSELLQDLKHDDVVRKGYVVEDDAVYHHAGSVSPLLSEEDADGQTTDRGGDTLALLGRLDEVTATQYEAARAAFAGEEPDRPAAALESLTNERYGAVLSELKSYTLTTDWPGNRVAADLATVATNLEIIGDRACFIADVVDSQPIDATGIVEQRVDEVFEAGSNINDLFGGVCFDADLGAYEDLVAREEAIHRDLDELFELVTAYEPEMYASLVTVTRALERAIFYWVHAAETVVRLHSGLQPAHARI